MVHVLRMDNTRHAKIAISWTPDGKKKERQSKKKKLEQNYQMGKTGLWVSVMDLRNQSVQRKR